MAMSSSAMAFTGAGYMFQGYFDAKSKQDQANAEMANADFYRDQANFAADAGARQLKIFDRESQVLYGEQGSAFAKAGVDTAQSSNFMAKEMFYRQEEHGAIVEEANMNIKLASLRAQQADSQAGQLRGAAISSAFGSAFNAGSNILRSNNGE